ncbi:MAG: hydroxyacid dehydrogenase [Clostridia bacterium]|nr:hydroxyacid dehydrogenase [Clostridia bacterium]
MKKIAAYVGSDANVNRVYSKDTLQTLAGRYDFIADGKTLTKEELLAHPDAGAVQYLFSTWGMPHFTNDEIRNSLPAAEAVFYGAGSVQTFAREFLEEGVAVYSAWAANGVPVAEYTFAQIILAATGFFGRLHVPGSGNAWPNRPDSAGWPGNYEIKVGIIGAGMIGKMVIERLHTLEKTEILVFDPFLSEEKAAELGVTKCNLAALFAQCDVISNHLANNPQTVGMLNAALFDTMKPHATFINTGRGAQVVEADMIKALQDVPTRCAVLDVTFPEPPVADSPLYTMSNVYLTPHIAGSLGNEVHRMAEYMAEEALSFDEGKLGRYSVTLKMLETMA